MQNKVQKVSNRLNDIASKLKEIQEELRWRPHITDFICKHFNRDGSQLDSNFLEIKKKSILEVIFEESKENNHKKWMLAFEKQKKLCKFNDTDAITVKANILITEGIYLSSFRNLKILIPIECVLSHAFWLICLFKQKMQISWIKQI